MMPEDRAAKVAHRILSPQSSWEQFERILLSQQRPDWNQAVGLIADAIRLECVDGYFPWVFWYADGDPEEIEGEQHRRLLSMYAPEENTNGNGWERCHRAREGQAGGIQPGVGGHPPLR